MPGEPRSRFVQRFNRIWLQARAVQLWQSLGWTILAGLAGLAAVMLLDYYWELTHGARVVAMAVVGAATLGVGLSLCVASLRQWGRGATAAAIEQFFPQLGQRVRTTVQFGELPAVQVEHEGIASTLVAALEEDTLRRAMPLPLDAVVPWRSLAVASLMAAVVGVGLTLASTFDPQWHTAAGRVLLSDEPYTAITIEPKDPEVREGDDIELKVLIEGRLGKEVVFWSRRLDGEDANWKEETLHREAEDEASGVTFCVPLRRVQHPLEFKVTTGRTSSDLHKLRVLYPLKIKTLAAVIQPPEYTGQSEIRSEGHITGLVGSHVRLTIELDREPKTASLELASAAIVRRGDEPPPPVQLPVTVEGSRLTAEFDLTTDQTLQVFAEAADGMTLPENKHRVRVRQDEPPQVYFEEPAEAMEVHTLAEVLMRIRVSDDIGLSRAGIMFEVNNEEEYPLLVQDFAAAATELRETGKLSPQTRATLEKVLPLEHFELTQQDSILYFAFAEDNRPASPQRTETDLRFIDIRPFKRTYRALDDGMGMPREGQGPQLKSLEELIARQRYALNRTLQTQKRFDRSGQADLAAVDQLIKFQGELAKSTRELAEGLAARGIDDTELLYQAESAMLAATDSLSAGKYDTATLQDRDALKYLIEGRNRIEISIRKNRNRPLLAQLRQFDRLQRQKIRRPKTDEEEAKQIAERLKELADQQEFVYRALNDAEGGQPMDELEDKQHDISTEARDIEKALGKLPKATDLAKERIAEAAKKSEEIAEGLSAGEKPVEAAQENAEKFRDLTEQVQALIAQEQADQIAAARQMAAELARQQRDFVDRLAKSDLGSSGESEKPMDAAGAARNAKPMEKEEQRPGLGAAQRIAEKAETLKDVLGAAGGAKSPEEEPAAEKLKSIIGSLKLDDLLHKLQQLPDQVGGGKAEEAKSAAEEGAERLEEAANALDAIHRGVVAPRLEMLAKVEKEIAGLDEDLDMLEKPADINSWHARADELADDLEKAGINEELRTQFAELIKQGLGDARRTGNWNWAQVNGFYQAPANYKRLVQRLQASLRNQLQELVLGEQISQRDEPTPPQYQELVDRFQQVLTIEGKSLRKKN